MIEMDHANFALGSYSVAEATNNGRSVSRSPIITDPATDLPGPVMVGPVTPTADGHAITSNSAQTSPLT